MPSAHRQRILGATRIAITIHPIVHHRCAPATVQVRRQRLDQVQLPLPTMEFLELILQIGPNTAKHRSSTLQQMLEVSKGLLIRFTTVLCISAPQLVSPCHIGARLHMGHALIQQSII